MATSRVMRVSEANAKLELAERAIPEPGPGEVRVRVQACGVCHSDMFAVTGGFPGVSFPVVPGHEIAGVVDALGDGVPAGRARADPGRPRRGGRRAAAVRGGDDLQRAPQQRGARRGHRGDPRRGRLAFSDLADVRPMIETMPLEATQVAYDRMMAGDARFRMVLVTGA